MALGCCYTRGRKLLRSGADGPHRLKLCVRRWRRMCMDEFGVVAAGVPPALEPGILSGGNRGYSLHYNYPLMGFTTQSFRAAGRAPSTSGGTLDATNFH